MRERFFLLQMENMNSEKADTAIELKGISKYFGAFKANDRIDFDVRFGEVHGLLGENGAGKTTLMNVLSGLLRPDEGQICVRGKEVNIKASNDAKKLGIQMVHQHFMLAMPYTALDNIILGCEPKTACAFIDKKKAREEIEVHCRECGFTFDLDEKVENLPVASRQKIEIVKALYNKCDILILDEPTAVLSVQESEELMEVVQNLKKAGKAIILITHKLNEALSVCDRISVLRHGKLVETIDVDDEVTKESLATAMVGHPVLFELPDRKAFNEWNDYLVMQDVTTGESKSDLHHVNLSVREGEIVGIAGVEGNGQKKLVEVILGLCRIKCGNVLIGDQNIDKLETEQLLPLVSHIAEDRHHEGYVNEFSLEENALLGRQREKSFLRKSRLFDQKKIRAYAEELIEQFDVRTAGIRARGNSLSGGNQQKLVVGREFSKTTAKLIIAEQPGRGLDIASMGYVQKELLKMRNTGKSVLLITADLQELLSVSDRIGVLYEGNLVAFASRESFDERLLGLYMTGGKPDE